MSFRLTHGSSSVSNPHIHITSYCLAESYFTEGRIRQHRLCLVVLLLLLLHYSPWWALASRLIGFLDNEIFFRVSGRQPNAPTPNLEDQWAALCLVPALRPVWLGWPYQELSSRQHSSQGRGTHKPPRHDKAAAPGEVTFIM